MSARADNRLLDAPMRMVECRRCSARVEVRKGSWQQTTVQWDAAAVARCEERRTASPRPGPNGDFFESCASLQASISDAATSGVLSVPDDGF